MNESPTKNLPPETLPSSEGGSEFIGLAVASFGMMNGFCFNLLDQIVSKELDRAGVRFQVGGIYDQNFAAYLLEVNDWRAAVRGVHGALSAFDLLSATAIFRMDASEGFWRPVHGNWASDFKSLRESINPEFSKSEMARLVELKAFFEKLRGAPPEKPAHEA